MKHPILLALTAGLLVLVAAFAAPLWQLLRGPAGGSGPDAAVAQPGQAGVSTLNRGFWQRPGFVA